MANVMTPISLHPQNPHYFQFRGKPTVLITSGEHYGSLLNLDFDFALYLRELESVGLNQTRLFSGAYREVPGSFGVASNNLVPRPERFCAPWPRSETPGARDGLTKFDLTRWNDAYFRRLDAICAEAGRRGVVVELVLFCPFYNDAMWDVSPMNAKNNVNGVGDVPRTEVYTRRHPDLLAVQEALTRKLVEATNRFDNIYYEICNEPYFGGVTLDWQEYIAATIANTQRQLPSKHLIAQNIANGSAEIKDPNPNVSVFNFHYASPPDAVRVNYHLNKPIAFDESGFRGITDAVYRTEAWEFLLAGGAVYSHLDYSFAVRYETGKFPLLPKGPGGGGPTLRGQLKVLADFVNGFDFVKMAPDNGVLKGKMPTGVRARALVERGKQYAVYIKGEKATNLTLDLPAGRYRAEWRQPITGAVEPVKPIEHGGGNLTLAAPSYTEDIALRLVV